MAPLDSRERGRTRRARRARKKIAGTTDRPRLAVHRSHLHLVVQIVNDLEGKTLLIRTTRDPDFRKKSKTGGSIEAARLLGEAVAQGAKKAGIQKVVFDRSGYPFHGRIKAVAEAARLGGLEF